VTHDPTHGFYLSGIGSAALTLVAHDVVPHCGMADQSSHIDAKPLADGRQVFADGFPGHFDRAQNFHGNCFHVRKELCEPLFATRAYRSKRERAVTDNHGRGAVITRECAQRIPRQLRIVMAVRIYEAGSNRQTVRIKSACSISAQLAYFGDLAVAYS